jgi:uncharacterized RDD family membrane protein YckC
MSPQQPGSVHPERTVYDKHTIETPEQLRLDFPVAGIGSRFLALVIDTLIQVAVTVVAILTLLMLSVAAQAVRAGRSSLWIVALAGFFFFLLFFAYFAIFEIVWNGQTPGKRAIGIRVISESGRPLTVAESIGRNLLRIVDQLPGFYAIGIVVALLNSRNQRLGDLLAGSIVVRESSLAAIKPVWQSGPRAGDRMLGASALSGEDMQLIEAFLNRRGDLMPDVRSRMASQILKQLKERRPFLADAGDSAELALESLAREYRSAGGV